MSLTAAKTVVGTGLTSGIGFDALKQLLSAPQPYSIIMGARSTATAQSAVDALPFDRASQSVAVLPLDLADLKGVKRFAETTLDQLGRKPIDYLLLNAGISNAAEDKNAHGSKWCEALIVNHFSQYYLVHLLREKLVESKARIVFVSSGAVRNVPDPSVMDAALKAGSGATRFETYAQTKFVQLLGAHWWRRQLAGQCDVVAVSPGLIPGTGLGRGLSIPIDSPDAKPISTGAESVLRALHRSDFPEDPDRIFLTSWGEWWEPDVIKESLDKDLQDKWSPSKEQLEKEEGITA